ncbi:hypothetical protein F4810DRAFT_665422 [Camillea tinctor]|nr:hypothetical protein F4810DRAFT_665422 [Camillea tinctor]
MSPVPSPSEEQQTTRQSITGLGALDSDDSLQASNMRLFKSGAFADVTVTCKDKTWKLHKAIICSRCPFFQKAFGENLNAETNTLVIEDWEPETVETALIYIYTAKINLRKKSLCHLIEFLLCTEFLCLDLPYKSITRLVKRALYKLTEHIKCPLSKDRLAIPDCVLDEIFYMAKAVFNPAHEHLTGYQEILLNFMVHTRLHACGDDGFVARLKEVPDFAIELLKYVTQNHLVDIIPHNHENDRWCSKCERVVHFKSCDSSHLDGSWKCPRCDVESDT